MRNRYKFNEQTASVSGTKSVVKNNLLKKTMVGLLSLGLSGMVIAKEDLSDAKVLSNFVYEYGASEIIKLEDRMKVCDELEPTWAEDGVEVSPNIMIQLGLLSLASSENKDEKTALIQEAAKELLEYREELLEDESYQKTREKEWDRMIKSLSGAVDSLISEGKSKEEIIDSICKHDIEEYHSQFKTKLKENLNECERCEEILN